MANRLERRKMGAALRLLAQRGSHCAWAPPPDRPDPLTLLRSQDECRLQHLVPIKYGRMAQSPVAFLRGSAVLVVADLATTPSTGLQVRLCGNAADTLT